MYRIILALEEQEREYAAAQRAAYLSLYEALISASMLPEFIEPTRPCHCNACNTRLRHWRNPAMPTFCAQPERP